MKKIIFVCLFSLGCFHSNAQLHLGAKAGTNLSKINGESFKDKHQLGYQLGGYVYYDFSNFFGLQVEAQFNQSNTEINEEYIDILLDAFEKKKKLNYISVPLLLRMNTQGGITLVGGPQFSFLADGNKTVLQNGKKLFKNTDIGFVAGIDLNLRPFVLYGRYIWGFNDISDVGNKANSRQIQLGVGFEIF